MHHLATDGPQGLVRLLNKSQMASIFPEIDWYDLLEVEFGEKVDRVLTREGIVVDVDRRRLVLDCVRDAIADADADTRRKVDGDYSPDPKAVRFPPPSEAKPNARSKLSLDDLFAEYIKELQAGSAL
ncbi:hypothetical protein ACMDCR_07855 [Labrys okinawensis]|uniref:hypothetical protein n=1 Tax=Labrys okinawensis TaxID=346911 RepID=UPI0039BC3210